MALDDFEVSLAAHPQDNVVPGLVNAPTIFIGPSAKTAASGELWFAVSCNDSNYGGCVVLASNEGEDYSRIGIIRGSATHGVLTATLADVAGLDETSILSVDLSQSHGILEGVKQATVDVYDSLCYVGGELLAYREADLTGVDLYDLSYLRRGLYGTTPGAASGADFALLNNAIFKWRFNRQAVDKTLYFKFQAFNLVQAGYQDLADCVEYTFHIAGDGGVKALLSDISAATVGKEDMANKVTAWSITPTDSNYPSEKLVKNSLDAISTPDLSGYAPLASPALTGTPTAPTATTGTNTTQIATTAFVAAGLAALVNSSPSTLDTLNELATALGDDPNFAATMATALAAKAPLASPALTGTPTAPTATAGTNTTQLATTAFVAAGLAALVNSSPSTLDTLNELATALGDDPNFAATMATALAAKAPLASPALTGTPTAPTATTGTNTTQLATTAFVAAAVSGGGGGGAISAIALLRASHFYNGSTQLAFNGNPAQSKTLYNNVSGLVFNASGQCTISFPIGKYIIHVVGNLLVAGHDIYITFSNSSNAVIAAPINSTGGTGGTATASVGTNYSQYFYLDLSAAGGNTVLYMGGVANKLFVDVVAANASTTFVSTVKIEKIG
ncbi:hypothetical protein KFZ76_11795 [Methylovulum psychrotolerans]|uniref:GTA baseplate fiber-binding domain-containing protein n=1 Tax=Methylovulum psychrotolerans TaxID=1704499 RepID=UPI001BFF6980|nr:hypothetical protein [Methylovulum psychrotolerans]MBT9098389.1 hypothetical protein [Methylovulum psychrotolerans]